MPPSPCAARGWLFGILQALCVTRSQPASRARRIWPHAANIHVERIAASALPGTHDAGALAAWLNERWARKEEALETLSLPGAARGAATPPPYATYAGVLVVWLWLLKVLISGLLNSATVRWACLIGCAAFGGVTFLGGLDAFEMRGYRHPNRAML